MITSATNSGRQKADGLYRILSLDGGGSKGFYTLGVLMELEAMVGRPLYQCFDLIFGTSTGAIIGSLLALGREVEEIHSLYKKHVPAVMKASRAKGKSTALAKLAHEVYGDASFTDVKTGIGIVATKWRIERPMVFKADPSQAHGRKGTFQPGFGVPIGEAVQASCSAYPLFERKTVSTASGDQVELIDGGYCANNPTLYAITDAVAALKRSPEDIRVVNVGVGFYPEPNPGPWNLWQRFIRQFFLVRLLSKTLDINTQSMDQLRMLLFKNVPTIRISDTFEKADMATDLMEHDLAKLNVLRQRGRESFGGREAELRAFLMPEEVCGGHS